MSGVDHGLFIPAEERFFEGPAGRLCYAETGQLEGPPVILVVGLGMQMVEWPRALVEGLAKDHRVVLLDNRDSGRSFRSYSEPPAVPQPWTWRGAPAGEPAYLLTDLAGDVEALAAFLGLEHFGLIGFSMGGKISQTLAAKRGDDIDFLVSLSSSDASPDVTTSAPAGERMEVLFEPNLSADELRKRLVESFCYFGFMEQLDAASEAALELVLERGFDCSGSLQQALAIRHSTKPDHSAITAPTLIVHGLADDCLDVSQAEAAAAAIEGARIETFEGLGHAIDDRVVQSVLAFVAGSGRR